MLRSDAVSNAGTDRFHNDSFHNAYWSDRPSIIMITGVADFPSMSTCMTDTDSNSPTKELVISRDLDKTDDHALDDCPKREDVHVAQARTTRKYSCSFMTRGRGGPTDFVRINTIFSRRVGGRVQVQAWRRVVLESFWRRFH